MDRLSKLLAGKFEFPKKFQWPVIFLEKFLSKFDHADIIGSLLVNDKHQEIIIYFFRHCNSEITFYLSLYRKEPFSRRCTYWGQQVYLNQTYNTGQEFSILATGCH